MFYTINLKTKRRIEAVEIKKHINDIILESKFSSGLCFIYSPHTTSAIMINESFDPAVVDDINSFLSKLVPQQGDYNHLEGNSDAHIKSSLIGSSKAVIVDNGSLVLGTWQGIFFLEFDGPRTRTVNVKLIEG